MQLKNLLWWMEPASLRWDILGSISSGSVYRSYGPEGDKAQKYFFRQILQTYRRTLQCVKISHVVLILNAYMDNESVPEAWHDKRTGASVGEGETLVAVEILGLRGVIKRSWGLAPWWSLSWREEQSIFGCSEHGMTTKDQSTWIIDSAWAHETSCMCCVAQVSCLGFQFWLL